MVDLWVVEGGRGRSGNIYNMAGEYVDLPTTKTTTWLRFRQTTGETLQDGDRVLIIVRTGFILDKCCRPVDGDHIGGRVPTVTSSEETGAYAGAGSSLCQHPPLKFGPWTSGNGSPGGTFESWFYIKAPEGKDQHQYTSNK